MQTKNLKRNDLSDKAYQWYREYLDVIDRKDLDAYAAYLADDCQMYMNNDGPIEGKEAILSMLGPYWGSFASLEHDLLNIFGNDEAWVLEALNHYQRHDGKSVTVRAVAITERSPQGLAQSVRVYSDPSPVFAEGAV